MTYLAGRGEVVRSRHDRVKEDEVEFCGKKALKNLDPHNCIPIGRSHLSNPVWHSDDIKL